MKSKEALEKLNNFIPREKHIDSERNKTINKCISSIEQDLEELKKLKIENQDLKDNETIVSNYAFNLIQENEKLKKQLDIYAKYTSVYFDEETDKYYISVDCDFGCKGDVITKEEFEVLENE